MRVGSRWRGVWSHAGWRPRALAGDLLVVGLVEEGADVVDAGGLAQEAAEGVFAEVLEDDFHGLEMFFGAIFGR